MRDLLEVLNVVTDFHYAFDVADLACEDRATVIR
jgi:hypothetical protein